MSVNRIIATCGIICTDCPSYQATQAGDQEALERVARQWEQEYHLDHVSVEDISCDGCREGERKCYHCPVCEIRVCGIHHGVANCAHCLEYACPKLEKFFGFVPNARIVLDQVRSSL